MQDQYIRKFRRCSQVPRCVCQVVGRIKAAVKRELGFSMSFGIAEGKLAARLAGPLHKPAGITVVPPQHAARFLLDTPILKVPLLRSAACSSDIQKGANMLSRYWQLCLLIVR